MLPPAVIIGGVELHAPDDIRAGLRGGKRAGGVLLMHVDGEHVVANDRLAAGIVIVSTAALSTLPVAMVV